METPVPTSLEGFIESVAAAVNGEDGSCCYRVKAVLEQACRSNIDWLPAKFLKPSVTGYARRLVYCDPESKFSILVMVWDGEQGTLLHDHAGMWCVECVYRGRIKVVSYDLNEQNGDIYHFTKQLEVHAGPGEAGALIPPFDYHTIGNDFPTASATIHIYGGEMTWCHAFAPEGDAFRRIERQLAYTPD